VSRPQGEPGRKSAAAISYDGSDAPRLAAAGFGHVADRILALAKEHGIPIREDPMLAQALAALESDRDIPPELWQAVAETLVWAYRLSGKSSPTRRGR
jgi:flagellar biosynthesis protein